MAVHFFRASPLGRIVTKTENIGGATATFGHQYDPAGRLVLVTKDGLAVESYSWDANGNRILGYSAHSGVDILPAGPYVYDAQDRLVSTGDATYSYTENGELLSKDEAAGTTWYSYDLIGNLKAVTLADGTAIEYVTDAKNRRVGKKVNGVLTQGFLYSDQLNPVAELDGSGNISARFVYGTRNNVPDYIEKGGVRYRVATDIIGSPRIILDTASLTVSQQIDYDSFGNIVSDTNPGFQPFGFAGGIYDRETNLTRFGSRDYDPITGRWTTKDQVRFDGGDINLYRYVVGDPVNDVDPTGRNPMAYPLLYCEANPHVCAAVVATCLGLIGIGNGDDGDISFPPPPGGTDEGTYNEDQCNAQLSEDKAICNYLPASNEVKARCHSSAMERYGNCLAGRPIQPLVTW